MKITNKFQMPPDGWMQLVPVGEYPNQCGDFELIQVIDDEALQTLRDNFPPELFIDRDHISLGDGESTEAMGWVMGVEAVDVRADGLYVKPRWSDEGEAAIEGGRYRYISPVFDFDSAQLLGTDETGMPRYRMTHLLEAGVTNRPNMRLAPLSNRKNFSPAGAGEKQTDPERVATKKEDNMRLVNQALDLSPDASEGAAVQEINELQDKVEETASAVDEKDKQIAELQATIKELEEKLKALEDQVEEHEEEIVEAQLDAAELENKEERKAYKTLLLANRESGTAALNALVAARKEVGRAKSPLTNRDTAQTPGQKKNYSADGAKAAFRNQIQKEEN